MDKIEELAKALATKAQSLIEDLEDTYETDNLGEKLDAIKDGLALLNQGQFSSLASSSALDAIKSVTGQSNVFDIIDAVKAAQKAFLAVDSESAAFGEDFAFLQEFAAEEEMAIRKNKAWEKSQRHPQ
jgi:hypothetical protein